MTSKQLFLKLEWWAMFHHALLTRAADSRLLLARPLECSIFLPQNRNHMKNINILVYFLIVINAGFAFSEPLVDGPINHFPTQVTLPADNAMTPEKIELGRKLFFETRLSKNNKLSCNSCHNVMKSGDDGLSRSPGHEKKLGGRNSPTVFNAAFNSVQFWDGRAPSLEEQAKGPIINPLEMGMANHDVVVELITKVPSYKNEFEKVFGPGPITINNLVKAIASYERTLVTPNSPYDKFINGDKSALNESAQRGWKLVQSIGCVACHSGPMFNGPPMPLGTGFYQKFPLIPGSEYEKKYRLLEDEGRFVATKDVGDKHMFRVPTWRNVARTSPYFHNGAVDTLEEAVRVMAKTQLGKTLPAGQVKDIVAFLTSLNGEIPKQSMPSLPK
jgi:cytochrome c peroxidase